MVGSRGRKRHDAFLSQGASRPCCTGYACTPDMLRIGNTDFEIRLKPNQFGGSSQGIRGQDKTTPFK